MEVQPGQVSTEDSYTHLPAGPLKGNIGEQHITPTSRCYLGLIPHSTDLHQFPADTLGGSGSPRAAHSKPSWQQSSPAWPPPSHPDPHSFTFLLVSNEEHLENTFPPTHFPRGLQAEPGAHPVGTAVLSRVKHRCGAGSPHNSAAQGRSDASQGLSAGMRCPRRDTAPGHISNCVQSVPNGHRVPRVTQHCRGSAKSRQPGQASAALLIFPKCPAILHLF